MNFLQDKSFLLKLNRFKTKEYYASVIALDFETEHPIARLEGKIISGSFNIAANSPTRKTGSFQIVFDNDTYNITEITNLIAIDKKISFSMGIKNPLYHMPQYAAYGKELWFNQGIFYITAASASINTNGRTITLNIVDKMAGLNGVCGGTLPASTSFHDSFTIDAKGDRTVEYPLIRDIIFEAVTHFGGEHPTRVIIEDVPKTGMQVFQYNGTVPLKFKPKGTGTNNYAREFIFGEPEEGDEYTEVYYQGDVVGYRETPLTYPGELIQKAGSTVTNLLDEIVKTLGNYEYFYDEEGNFHFRQIRNFESTKNTPLNFNATVTTEVIDSEGHRSVEETSMDKDLQSLYLPRYSNYQYLNEFADSELVTQITLQPKWDNIKNDFVCWGSKNNTTKESSTMVRYHLAIDERPKDIKEEDADGVYRIMSLCHQKIWAVKSLETKMIVRYQTSDLVNDGEVVEFYCDSLDNIFKDFPDRYKFNWREELYRKALLAYGTSTKGSEYDEELMAEWRDLFDPMNEEFKEEWQRKFGITAPENPMAWSGYNIAVQNAPNNIRYWLDIVDSNSPIGKYSIKRIGKRTKVNENSKINEVFDVEIPPVVFILNTGDMTEMQKFVDYYVQLGQDYTFITEDSASNFSIRNSFGTCYDDVRSLLNKHLLYNTSISLTSLPIFYLEVNSVVHLGFSDLGISGDFVINTITWQINQTGGTMTLQLNEAVTIN